MGAESGLLHAWSISVIFEAFRHLSQPERCGRMLCPEETALRALTYHVSFVGQPHSSDSTN